MTVESGWIATGGTDHIHKKWRETGPAGRVALWTTAMKWIKPDQITEAVAWLKGNGIEMQYDAQLELWVGRGVTTQQINDLNVRIYREIRSGLKLTIWASQEWQEMRKRSERVVRLGPDDAPWGMALNTGLPGRWQVESLWTGRTQVGFRARFVGKD